MQRPNKTMLRIGEWYVNPAAGTITRGSETARLEVRTMRLLVCLAEHAGEVVSIDDLLTQVWPDVTVSQDSAYQAVATLRRLLGDDPKQPAYIATVPRMGYRMIAEVSPWAGDLTPVENMDSRDSLKTRTNVSFQWFLAAFVFFLGVVLIAAWWRDQASRRIPTSTALAAQPQSSIGVLPFLDLTGGMKEEEFADGITEDLIDKFSKAGLRVPSATSAFFYKGKQVPLSEIAKALGVAYVLDGSVRKSGERLRIAARLVRVDSGYVVWSETYDRPFIDRIMVQDDIASEVTKALVANLGAAR